MTHAAHARSTIITLHVRIWIYSCFCWDTVRDEECTELSKQKHKASRSSFVHCKERPKPDFYCTFCTFVLSVLNTTRKWCTLHSGFRTVLSTNDQRKTLLLGGGVFWAPICTSESTLYFCRVLSQNSILTVSKFFNITRSSYCTTSVPFHLSTLTF